MSAPETPEPATLILGLLLLPGVSTDEVLSRVAEQFGRVRSFSAERPFGQSAYYDREMGSGLRRLYAGFEEAVDPGALADLKLRANALEARWSEGGRRRVNLDPGLLDLTHLVLASAKSSGHRVYLGKGIYAEIEYVFIGGSFQPLPWTYPDYREPDTVSFFNELREAHRANRKISSAIHGPQPATHRQKI